MEDILASIRRIIADDQMHANRPASATPRRATTERSGDPTRSERTLDYAEVLDLARTPAAAAADGAPHEKAEQVPPALVNGAAHEEARVYEARLFEAREQSGQAPSPKQMVYDQPGQGSGYGTPTLVRDYEQSGSGSRDSSQAELAEEDADDDHLVSPALGTTVMSAFETLAATVVLQNSDMLDRVMRELMRPLIKSWLDENLPTLVERLVRTEIERVARGGRT